jgi:hypothetical protein
MKTQTHTQTSPQPSAKNSERPIKYSDLTRGAALNGIRATVLLETRVLAEFAELDPALGHNTAGVIFSVLLSHLAGGNGGGDDRLTICLTRRSDGQLVEVDLMLLRRRQQGGQRFYLRIADVREIPDQADS